jgi:hypoxanthine phosphoribosyltransferase
MPNIDSLLPCCLCCCCCCPSPLQAIGLTLYEHEDCCDPLDRPVRKTQWLTYSHVHGTNEAAVSLQGHTILIVDEVRQ